MTSMTRVMEITETQIVTRLGQARIIALAVLDEPEQAELAGAALMRGGLRCVELAVPRRAVIRAARRVDGLLVGAGNVHTVEQAEEAVRGGAHYATAPATNMAVVHACRELELPFFPGVATPSEIERLVLLGLRTLRLFPAAPLGGPAYLQAIAAIYPQLRLIASGGIGPETLRTYIGLPSVLAVCCGSLVRPDLLRSGSFDRIEFLARDVVRACLSRRGWPAGSPA
jgi:2-dehydro-3-deoxyphosphogluconate aldolase / (4S)-4-hydroxy-2-oxoglutarate aldolase